MFQQSKKASFLIHSEIRNMSIECDRVNGINLSQGICDLPLDPILAQGVHNAMARGENYYTRYDGVEPLREQIAKKARSFNGINAAKENIVVSSGATGALYSACYALLNPGDEVILFQPYYGYHEYTLKSLDLCPVYGTLRPPEWTVDFDELERLITPKTRAMILCTPSNPCGKVFSLAELEQLGKFCARHGLLVFTDEIYEYITYDGHRHISPASLPVFAGRTVTISGYSKTFSITGWRIGYALSDVEVAKWIGHVSDLLYVCAPAPLQYGVAEGIRQLPESYYMELAQDLLKKRNLLCGALTDIGLMPHVPHGAYYILAQAERLPGSTSKEKAMYLLKKTGVGTVPGSAFYVNDQGENLLRFCFAKEFSVIERACEQLRMIK